MYVACMIYVRYKKKNSTEINTRCFQDEKKIKRNIYKSDTSRENTWNELGGSLTMNGGRQVSVPH